MFIGACAKFPNSKRRSCDRMDTWAKPIKPSLIGCCQAKHLVGFAALRGACQPGLIATLTARRFTIDGGQVEGQDHRADSAPGVFRLWLGYPP